MILDQQKGQALPLGMAFLMVGALGAFVLFNTGKVASEKMNVVNTADAAAYSGTLWQARALNFQSYSNRAMVANQVSIAQAVTLQSWVAYGAITSENIAVVLSPVPIINAVASGLETGLRVVDSVMSPISKAMVSIVDVVNRGLSKAQEAMFVSTFAATPEVVKQLVQQNDSRFTVDTGFSGLGLLNNLQQWRNFTDGFSKNDEAAMTERELLINDSRDAFTQKRNWDFFNFWFYTTPFTRHRIFREGETRLIRVDTDEGIHWEWKAKDTMSLHSRLSHWRGTKRYEVPVGWAEAFANTKNSDRTIEPGACTSYREMRLLGSRCSRFLGRNGYSEAQADVGLRSLKGTESRIDLSGYTGVQAYRSLSQATIQEDRPHLRLKVEVALPANAINGSDDIGARGRFAAPISAPGDMITSVSVAEVFYKRPDSDLSNGASGANAGLERANGYNPYWDNRLSPIDPNDRLLAFAMRAATGGGTAPDGVAGHHASLSRDPEAGVQDLNHTTSAHSSSLPEDWLSEGNIANDLLHQSGFDQVASQFAQENLSELRGEIESLLIDSLENSIRNMLAGRVAGSLGLSATTPEELGEELEQLAMNEVGDLASDGTAQEIMEVANEAVQLAEELHAEFERIRGEITTQFQDFYEEALVQYDAGVAVLQARINVQQERLDFPSYLNDEARDDVMYEISRIREQIAEMETSLHDELTMGLLEVINGVTDLYQMPYRDAAFVVAEFLRADEPVINLPWLDTSADDDDE